MGYSSSLVVQDFVHQQYNPTYFTGRLDPPTRILEADPPISLWLSLPCIIQAPPGVEA